VFLRLEKNESRFQSGSALRLPFLIAASERKPVTVSFQLFPEDSIQRSVSIE